MAILLFFSPWIYFLTWGLDNSLGKIGHSPNCTPWVPWLSWEDPVIFTVVLSHTQSTVQKYWLPLLIIPHNSAYLSFHMALPFLCLEHFGYLLILAKTPVISGKSNWMHKLRPKCSFIHQSSRPLHPKDYFKFKKNKLAHPQGKL